MVETISTTKTAAEAALDRGFTIFPLKSRSKQPATEHGFKDASPYPEQIEKWWNALPDANIGIATGESGLIVLDFDEGTAPEGFDFPETYAVKTARGLHLYYWGSRPGTNMFDATGKMIGQIKSQGGYVLGAGSVHPDGPVYTPLNDVQVAEAPAELIEKLTKKPGSETKVPVSVAGDKIPFGQHDTELFRIACKLRQDGMEEEGIYNAIVEVCEKRALNFGSDYREMCRKCARSACKYSVGSATVLQGGRDLQTGVQLVDPPNVSPDPSIGVQQANANITIPFSEDIFYGLAGRIIKKLQPETESHPVGNLLELLACVGNIMGPCAYYKFEDTHHYTNLFVVKVGRSSKSRKGTGKARIERIAAQLDSIWYASRNISGLGSGEIVVHEVRDAQEIVVKDKKTDGYKKEIVPGVDDKRLYVSEGEFAGILAVAGRKDSILSKIIRDAWDHKPLRNAAKSGSSVCMNPHISISADITRSELNTILREADKSNGFANRFLWCHVERQGKKPFGGEDIDWSNEIVELYHAVEFARKQKRVFMDRNARLMWERIYDEFEDITGVLGDVINRGEPQVIRLALIFALLDLSDHIAVEHLKAAQALWQYCESSARVIFGGVMKEHERILGFLRAGPKTKSEIRDALFQRHRLLDEIQIDLNTLVALGRVYVKTEGDVERYHLIGN